MVKIQFEWYVLNEDFNKRVIEPYNVFNNYYVNKHTYKAIKKYLRAPAKYKYEYSSIFNKEPLYGFEALCEEIRTIISWQEWSRCEYEIVVGSLFNHPIDDIKKLFETTTDQKELLDKIKEIVDKGDNLRKTDCYTQCVPNIKAITHECIRQYKEQMKNGKTNEE